MLNRALTHYRRGCIYYLLYSHACQTPVLYWTRCIITGPAWYLKCQHLVQFAFWWSISLWTSPTKYSHRWCSQGVSNVGRPCVIRHQYRKARDYRAKLCERCLARQVQAMLSYFLCHNVPGWPVIQLAKDHRCAAIAMHHLLAHCYKVVEGPSPGYVSRRCM